jgi:hypothetical protein
MSKILNLCDYDIVFTTSFECTHGLSGHLYEQIEYHFLSLKNGFKSLILLTDGTKKETLILAIKNKYDFSDEEILLFYDTVIECYRPKILIVKNLCVVDGSALFASCVVYANNIYLLRCSQSEFTKFSKAKTIKKIHLMQDFLVYGDKIDEKNIILVDYVKKILWNRYRKYKDVKTNTGLLYLTTNMRKLSLDDIQKIMKKTKCEKYMIITNNTSLYEDIDDAKITVIKGPVNNVFELFDTYIYTSTSKKFDCSPRFIVECAVFGKSVEYFIDYDDPGIIARKKHIENNLTYLHLNEDDHFFKYMEIFNEPCNI